MPAPVSHDFRVMVRTEERGVSVPLVDELRVYFSRFGHVLDCYIPKNHPYMAFVTLANEVELRASLVDDRPFICGVQVNLNHRPKGGPNDRSHLSGTGGPMDMMQPQMGSMGGMGQCMGGAQQGMSSNFIPIGGHQQPQMGYPSAGGGGGGGGGGSRRLYVTQLNESINEDMLRMYFGYFGPVLDAYIPTDNVTGQRRPYAYVTMASAHDAMKVMQLPSHQITEQVRIMACLAEPEGQSDFGGGMQTMGAVGCMGGMDSMGGMLAMDPMGAGGGMGYMQPQGMVAPAMLGQAPFGGGSMIKQGVLGDHRLHIFGMPPEVNADHLRGHFARHGELLDVHVPPEKPDCAYITFSTQEELLDALAYSGTRIAGIVVEGMRDASPKVTAREGHSAPY